MVSDEQIGAYWDHHIGPGLEESGMPDDGLQHLRGRYIQDVRANPEALRQLEELVPFEDPTWECPNGLPLGLCGDDPDCRHPPCS